MLENSPAFSSFSVDDIDAALTFYRESLGVKVDENTSMPIKLLHLQLGGGGSVMIYPKDDHQPATFTVLNFHVDDIDAAVEQLSGKGVTFEHYSEDPLKTDEKGIARPEAPGQGPAVAWFKDPAGNILAVMEEMNG